MCSEGRLYFYGTQWFSHRGQSPLQTMNKFAARPLGQQLDLGKLKTWNIPGLEMFCKKWLSWLSGIMESPISHGNFFLEIMYKIPKIGYF